MAGFLQRRISLLIVKFNIMIIDQAAINGLLAQIVFAVFQGDDSKAGSD